MSNDIAYRYRREEAKKNGDRWARRNASALNILPCDYGVIKNNSKRRGGNK